MLTKRGLISKGDEPTSQGELMLRGSAACDGEVIVRLTKPTLITISANDHVIAARLANNTYRAHGPASSIVDGINVVALAFQAAQPPMEALVRNLPPMVVSIELRPPCRDLR